MGTCASGSGNASGSGGWGCRAAAWCHGGATVAPRETGAIGALRAVVHAVTRTTHHTYACPKNEHYSDTSIPQREEPRAARDTPSDLGREESRRGRREGRVAHQGLSMVRWVQSSR
jgi:hypothetical protein